MGCTVSYQTMTQLEDQKDNDPPFYMHLEGVFRKKEEFNNRLPRLCSNRNYFMESTMFDHDDSLGNFPSLTDN